MSAASDYLENEILDHILGTGSWSSPAAVYIALYTAAPSDAGGGTEVVGNGYARQSCAFDAAASGTTDNTSEVAFPQASGAWGTITHFGIFDAATAGNLLIWGALTASKTVASGDIFTIQAGDLDITAA